MSDTIAVSSAWQAGKDFRTPFVHHLETSKQDVLLHRIDMSDILGMGLVDDLDFTAKAMADQEKKTKKGEDEKGEDESQESTDEPTRGPFFENGGKNFLRLQTLVNAVCVAGIIDPKVYPEPDHDKARQKGLLYINDLPWDDRMELFGVIFGNGGGTEESFLEESPTDVGTLENVTDVPLPADELVASGPDESARVLSESSSV